MTPKLRSMLTGAAVVVLSGVGFLLYTPQPATRSMLELRDAGITDGPRFVLTCPERLTAQTRRRINAAQPGLLRPKQSYGRVARTAVCFNPDAGNCFRPADGDLILCEVFIQCAGGERGLYVAAPQHISGCVTFYDTRQCGELIFLCRGNDEPV